MTKTRFDICYIMSQLSQFSSNLIDEYYTQLKWVLRYIKGTINMKIAYKRDRNIIINIWTDATWAKDIDNKKLTNIYVFRSADAPIT